MSEPKDLYGVDSLDLLEEQKNEQSLVYYVVYVYVVEQVVVELL
jgi:hypothetical protein